MGRQRKIKWLKRKRRILAASMQNDEAGFKKAVALFQKFRNHRMFNRHVR